MTDEEPPSSQEGSPVVGVHVHFGATGSVPLRLADLFFTDDGLYIVEYGTFTPLFGLATGGHVRAAERMARTYAESGFEAARERGNRLVQVAYDEIDRVVCHDGGRFARERIAVHVTGEPPYAYRVHAPVDLDAFVAGLDAFGPTTELTVVHRSGVGFSPLGSVRRFLAGR